ncbi:acyltransferase [Edaphobacter sp. 12200R-103]|uniref:acyltransferase family protein n=1 Tax=Edaphobacter sp. 12200R-103 TaxID=2703788 RepID=UPI00138C5965|nr:acyltransferase [Edaphobacter sp. 12200R-103]QHS52118.1 acyltransferase [Edaphobacter sp. 12200R-103]
MGLPNRETVSFPQTTASVLLDLIRGLAAILVLLSHWKILYFVDYPKIPSHRIFFAFPYVLAAAGHQAVLIFFVLSGYLIGGSIFRSVDRGAWSWKSYLTHRFVRLWVVLIPGLVLGGLLDWTGMHLRLTQTLYSVPSPKTHSLDIAHTLAPHIFWGNVAFLQTVLVPVFGSNGSLWSLANEFWYYLLFPLLWLALTRNSKTPVSLVRRIIYLCLFLALAWFLRSSLLNLFPVWLAGTLLARIPPPSFGPKIRATCALLYFVLLMLSTKVHALPGLEQDYVLGIVTFFFFWSILSARERAADSRFTHFSRNISRFSYTLYVVHMPALLFLTALFAGYNLWSPTDLRHHAMALVILAAVLLYAWIIATFTEFRTDRVRRWVENLLGADRPHQKSSSVAVQSKG